jgi:SAM-dependent methyltransferase
MDKSKLQINYKEYYENDGKRTNIWKADRKNFLYFREILRYKRLARLFSGRKAEVLDLGCGDGYVSCMLAEAGHKVDAMDISEERLSKFRDRAEKLGITQICGSVYEYDFPKNYDVVVMSEVIEHLEEYDSILDRVYNIIKPGGRFIIAVPYREKLQFCKCPYCLKDFSMYGHIHTFSEETFNNISHRLGCTITHMETFNNKLSAFTSRFSPIKSYGFYKFKDKIFSLMFKKYDTHIIVELSKI